MNTKYRPIRPGAIPDVLTPEQWQRLPERPRSEPGSRGGLPLPDSALLDGIRTIGEARADAEQYLPYIVLRYTSHPSNGGQIIIQDVVGPFLDVTLARKWAASNRADGGFSVLPVSVPAMRDLLLQVR